MSGPTISNGRFVATGTTTGNGNGRGSALSDRGQALLPKRQHAGRAENNKTSGHDPDPASTDVVPPAGEGPPHASATADRDARWLARLFYVARVAPWFLKLVRPAVVRAAVRSSPTLYEALVANARRIAPARFPPNFSDVPPFESSAAPAFAHAVVGNFYDFVADIGRSSRASREQLMSRIASVEGHDRYTELRKGKRGAILVTAHMGSFEIGLAALRAVEPKISVVFKRDAFGGFENIRRQLRKTLHVAELPIDDGWPTLIKLRDALLADEVVVMQGDRAMPGQRAQRVPVLGGHLMLPLGPVRLAQSTGSPIVPVYVVRERRDQFRVYLDDKIDVSPDAKLVDGVDPALRAIGRSIEKFVGQYPEQWLVLEKAFVEDQSQGKTSID